MPEGYHHLTKFQRCQIETLLQSGDSKAVIASAIKVNELTVRSGIKRNSGLKGCRYYNNFGESLTGARYVPLKYGPCPDQFRTLYEGLKTLV